jgi:hypothetical protein
MRTERAIPAELLSAGREHEERTREFSIALAGLERVVFGQLPPMIRRDGRESGVAESVHDILRMFGDIRGAGSARELAAALRREMTRVDESDRSAEWDEVQVVLEDILRTDAK